MRGGSSLKTVKMASQLNFQDVEYVGSKWQGLKNWSMSRKFELSFATCITIAFIILASVNHQNYQNRALINSRFGNLTGKTDSDIEDLFEKVQDLMVSNDDAFEKISELEDKQDTEFENIQKELAEIESERILPLEDQIKKTDFHAKAAAARSCQELYDHGFTKSGYYLVDPDGRYSGQSSFEVYCQFFSYWNGHVYVETIIQPKTSKFDMSFMSTSDKDFKQEIQYNATNEQIASLITNSVCYQGISWNKCLVMPLHFQEINHGYWKDRSGTERYFFDGYDFKGRNCKCFNSPYDTCGLDPNALCNCDTKYGSEDEGIIKSDWILPITEVGYNNHGQYSTKLRNRSATIIIGDLRCRDNRHLSIKSLGDLEAPIEKVYWSDWKDFVVEFDIEFSQKFGQWTKTGMTNFGSGVQISHVKTTVDTWVIFEAKRIGSESPELFAQVTYDAKNGKLIFSQKTQTKNTPILRKQIEIDEFELNKKIRVRVTTSKIHFDGKSEYYVTTGNELKSKKTQVTINYLQEANFFNVTGFSIRNVNED